MRKQKLDAMSWKEFGAPVNPGTAMPYPVALPKKFNQAGTERFSSKEYKKGTRLFNFHSWAPGYDDPDFTFSLYSDNILNTFSNQLFYRITELWINMLPCHWKVVSPGQVIA